MGKKFRKLEHKIEREYERKGVSPGTAEKWARATAGKVYREKEAKHSCHKCGACHGNAKGMHMCHKCGVPCTR